MRVWWICFLTIAVGYAGEPLDVPPLAIEGAPGAAEGDFGKEKRAFKTRLLREKKSPIDYAPFVPDAGTRVVRYKSGELVLNAWYRVPASTESGAKKVPAVVYFHSSFVFSKSDLVSCQPFLDAGFAVLCPSLRAENGNPGHFELFYGEADDGVAAAKWLAQQPEIDATRIYAFGHSAGGAISALLSLYREAPLRFSGSSGGIYVEEALLAWQKEMSLLPFDAKNAEELRLRLLAKNTNLMVRPHVAIIGKSDGLMLKAGRQVQLEVDKTKAPLKFAVVEGDHDSSLKAAVGLFLAIIQKDFETKP